MLSVAAVLALWQFSGGVLAQKAEKPKTAQSPSSTDKKGALKSEASPNNADYAAKVKENTTQSYFMTELVDHLPASTKIPLPDRILGCTMGASGHLPYTKDMYRYYHELEKTTARVRTFVAPEKSEEGKGQLLVAVGDEDSIAKRERYKTITWLIAWRLKKLHLSRPSAKT